MTDKKVAKQSARILNYRQGRRTQTPNQIILNIGAKSKEDANKYLGRKVVYTTSSGKELHGVITRVHGNSGAVIARFSKGLPGQALGKDVALFS
ncbi:50S ribosomal protein L35ae [archaeon CG10_big_fil_rev_8_21_14_0_10_43_11]|nr:MAG: 50S ribosomal protein L35ae [archaeon CG10_big_fil_rev_8_21_14_0_10_43_11]